MDDSLVFGHFTLDFAKNALNVIELPRSEPNISQLSIINDQIRIIVSKNLPLGTQLEEFSTFFQKYHERIVNISQEVTPEHLDEELWIKFTETVINVKEAYATFLRFNESFTKIDSTINTSQNESEESTLLELFSLSESQIPSDMKDALKTSRTVRHHKLELFEKLEGSTEFKQQILNFEKELVKLEYLFFDFQQSNIKFKKNP